MTPDAPAWQDEALCARTEGDWFPGDRDPKATERAKSVCRRCPVRLVCLQWALDHREPDGIWGGLDEAERWRLLDNRPEPPPREVTIAHGTEPGYRAHKRLGQEPCHACDRAGAPNRREGHKP